MPVFAVAMQDRSAFGGRAQAGLADIGFKPARFGVEDGARPVSLTLKRQTTNRLVVASALIFKRPTADDARDEALNRPSPRQPDKALGVAAKKPTARPVVLVGLVRVAVELMEVVVDHHLTGA
jgi:hypothetical protein